MPKIVTFGEVLLRLSTPNFQKLEQATSFNVTFGGTEMNVGASLVKFGFDATHVTVFPNNLMGQKAKAFLRALGVNDSHAFLEGDRIGSFFLETGAVMRASQIVYDRADSAFAKLNPELFDWEKILEGADWFHWCGITPAISEGAAKACLEAVKTAKKMGITVSSDIYYRSNLWKYGKTPQEILPELASYSDIILASRKNIEEIFSLKVTVEKGKFVEACKLLMEHYPNVKKVIDTDRIQVSASHNQYNAKMWNGEELIETEYQDITHIVDRIGTGDAFLGGFVYGQIVLKDDLQSLKFGTAAAALKHTIEGDQNLVTVPEVEAVMSGDKSGRLRR
ncbi:PfkB domain protein [Emticicia oligotrophica DSM 17448]|uniref:PfkB domain protein n=1 Tax=Emticicia oligotrophica (strain DSM 17448 / CIP 109782 / MTCC 6937 / GPTSA100-15) TaxID=929562 RepID=A0ABN4AKB7_EMTOG|nr:sugar kinase [Emticicia oligotrophica]AFK02718.1 PfkB domain protein [Emticicia oligotrophica DSM 17448]